MKNSASLSCLILSAAFLPSPLALAQDAGALHVVKSTINAESENAEFCLEFDKPLAAASPSHRTADLQLEAEGKIVTPANIATTDSSLCLFPLERGKSYRLDVQGLRGAGDEKMAEPYKSTFTIPDRSPTLAFTSKNGGVNEFGSYDKPLTLRAVNVARAKIDVYKITDAALMAHVWQDRAQTALAPSESAYLARSKGQTVWREEDTFTAAPNTTSEQEISLRGKLPDLAPGLYMIVADAGDDEAKPANKGLEPLAAAWFTKSDFSLDALRDSDGIHVFASRTETGATGVKGNVHLTAFNKKPEQLADTQSGADGISLIAYPPKPEDQNELASIVGIDPLGNVAFADIKNLPPLSGHPALGIIHTDKLFATPLETVDVLLSLTASENAPALTGASVLRLSQGDFVYADFPVPPLAQNTAKLSFPAPATQGEWTMRWQKADGTVLADAALPVAANADAPHLEVTSERDSLSGEGQWPVTIKSLSSSGKPVPLTSGQILIGWQKLDPETVGLKDYRFGTSAAVLNTPAHIANFLTDPQGTTQVRLTLPPRPTERGLYQAILKVVAEPDAGIADAAPLILPLRPEGTAIGIKPLAAEARFTQNGIARFALVGLSTDGKPRDLSNLSYQVYEEGRSFAWYQNEGRWKYKPEAQLRPIGGGALSIKADGSSVLEWPVTAGNYRLEILDPAEKVLAQTVFSAGWDSTGASAAPALPLNVQLPKTLQPGHEAIAHVTLPEPAMVTAIVADTHIRKIVHEFRPKGDNTIVFTPAADWPKTISLNIEAVPQDAQKAPRRAVIEASVAQSKTVAAEPAATGTSLFATYDPQGLVMHKDGAAVLTFGIENNNLAEENYHYVFTASPGLKIDGVNEGTFALAGKQSRSLSLPLSGTETGNKELRLEITGAHTSLIVRNWSLAVLPKTATLSSVETVAVASQEPLLAALAKAHEPQASQAPLPPAIAFVSRRPMNGVAEILSYVLNAHPFTTGELALSITALRHWSEPLDQAGIAPDFLVTAKMREQEEQMLRHQNPDGGFASYRGGDSTITDTAAALTALSADTGERIKPTRNLAIGWLKQRLSNTWFDEKERSSRAVAYAALADANAVDPSSLHYFSDTSAASTLPPLSEIHIAAAFKQIRDPDAEAFWVKKMMDQNGSTKKSVALLNALASTDALSSDDVRVATTSMANELRHGKSPDIMDAAALLCAIAIDNANAGKGHVTNGSETHEISGILALRTNDAAKASLRNGDAQPLSVTFVSEVPSAAPVLQQGPMLTRHIYRLNGVELQPGTKPLRNEIYMVELKGELPAQASSAPLLVQDGGDSSLRPMGCPLSSKLDTLSFIPWFTTNGLTPISACEFSSHEINAVLAPMDSDKPTFSIVYFAHIDAQATADIPQPSLRLLK